MAEMTGLEFLQQAAKLQSAASRILITGVLTLKTIIAAINTGEIYRFIAKPWLREELLATIRNAVQAHQLVEVNRKLQEDTLRLNEQLAGANSELQGKIGELTRRQKELEAAHEALHQNFQHSLELVHRIIAAFHPVLGQEIRQVARSANAWWRQASSTSRSSTSCAPARGCTTWG
jgi:response regulator RpfG family c-di-GMP phosphodiesterase